MSVIKCPECQHEVSSKASSCPNCGVAIAGNVKRCPICKSFVLMSATECPHCQAKFVVTAAPLAMPPGTAPANGDATDTSKPAASLSEVSTAREETQKETPAEKKEEKAQVETPETPRPELSEPPQDEPSKPKKSSLSTWLTILATLAIIIGGFFYFDIKNKEAEEEKAFMMLEGSTDKLNYEDFIYRFPHSRHLEEVKRRFHTLEQVDSVWNIICAHPTVEALERFLEQNPTTPLRKTALQKIDSIDWYSADRQGTVAAYDAYIVRHDNGEYITQAYSAREVARQREERARQDSIAAADSIAALGQ